MRPTSSRPPSSAAPRSVPSLQKGPAPLSRRHFVRAFSPPPRLDNLVKFSVNSATPSATEIPRRENKSSLAARSFLPACQNSRETPPPLAIAFLRCGSENLFHPP